VFHITMQTDCLGATLFHVPELSSTPRHYVKVSLIETQLFNSIFAARPMAARAT